jgi:hypothetical protein
MGNCCQPPPRVIDPEEDEFWSFFGECCVCMENPIQTSLYPCQHLIMCVKCTQGLATHSNQNLQKCPICRRKIQGYTVFQGKRVIL